MKLLDQLLKNPNRPIMPIYFIGHGSPMNGIENNEFSQRWANIKTEIETPVAILVISAHWVTKGTAITGMEHPKTIHDFGGFPKELYEVDYPAKGNPILANEIQQMITVQPSHIDYEWGLDHGTWTIIRHIYPEATIPILQLSIDYALSPIQHYELAQQLSTLRNRGVLIIGSGNLVHNLSLVAWDKMSVPNFSFDWASEANETFKKLINQKDHKSLIQYQQLGKAVQMAIPSSEHYLPLLYILALEDRDENIEIFNDKAVGGSLTMTSIRIG